FIRRACGAVEPLQFSSLPLGVLADERYDGRSITLERGDVLMVYTDGLKEARPDLWSTPHALASHLDGSAAAIVDRFMEGARAAAARVDDATVLVVRRAC